MSQAAIDLHRKNCTERGQMRFAMLVLAALCEDRTAPFYCRVSLAEIAAEMRFSERRALETMKLLIESGSVLVEKGESGVKKTYRLTPR